MQSKPNLELEDFEAENLAKLQKLFSRKWEFIYMQAEAQYKYDLNYFLDKCVLKMGNFFFFIILSFTFLKFTFTEVHIGCIFATLLDITILMFFDD